MSGHARQTVNRASARPGKRGSPPHRGRWGHVYAALDLGTNNCRLLVARPQRRGFSVIDAFSRTVRLGEGMNAGGRLSDEAMERAAWALRVCAEKMARRQVTRARAIATQACREASNGTEFVRRVGRDTGIDLEIVTPEEEARLAAVGCLPLVDRTCDLALVFDIGGGSTELIWIDVAGSRRGAPRILAWTSLPCGVVTLAERHGRPHIPVTAYPAMVEELRGLLARFERAAETVSWLDGRRAHMLGTSGTVTTLAGVSLGLPKYERARVDGLWLDAEEVRALCSRLSRMEHAARAASPCIGRDRANLVLAGCAILEAVHTVWPCPRLRVADRGLREGMLLDLMSGSHLAPAAEIRL